MDGSQLLAPKDKRVPRSQEDIRSKAIFYLTRPFAIDLRTLALFRICLGLMVIIDLILRSRDLVAFHTDLGVFPRSIAVQDLDWTFSFHFINGTAIFQATLFVVHAFFALLMIVGYRTRISTLLTLVLTISVQARNPYIVQGSDILLTVLLFWSLFLPLGARFSFDEGLNETPPQSNYYVSVASAALLLQAMSVYFFSALAKDFYPPWNSDFTGVLYALRGGSYGTFLGQWFGQFETLAYWLTHYVMYLEFYGPFLMFLTAYFAPARLFLQFLFITMHLGFLLFLGVGQFPWISITSLLAFTPSAFWDELTKRIRTPERLAIKIYYDEPCGFCRKLSLILRSFLLFPETPVVPAQKTPKIHAILEKNNSWVVTDLAGKAHIRWDAMLTLIRHSPVFGWLTPLLSLDLFKNLGERFYSWVAANRERLADKTAPWLVMRKQNTRASWITSDVVFFFLVVMLLGNITYINNKPTPPVFQRALRGLNLYQPWIMFMHTPSFREWYLARGVTKGGEVVDVFRNKKGEPSLDVPKYASEGGWDPNYRWRKFVTNMWYPSLHFLRPYYAAYLCRRWNSKHQGTERIVKITVIYAVGGGPLNSPTAQYPWNEFECTSAYSQASDF
jgi:predicted DCC family thiol-disulfide oxidoreductase YuxK